MAAPTPSMVSSMVFYVEIKSLRMRELPLFIPLSFLSCPHTFFADPSRASVITTTFCTAIKQKIAVSPPAIGSPASNAIVIKLRVSSVIL